MQVLQEDVELYKFFITSHELAHAQHVEVSYVDQSGVLNEKAMLRDFEKSIEKIRKSITTVLAYQGAQGMDGLAETYMLQPHENRANLIAGSLTRRYLSTQP